MQILLPFLLAPKKAEEKIRWHPEAADSPLSWNCLDLDNILGISKLLLLKFILKRNIFISSAIFFNQLQRGYWFSYKASTYRGNVFLWGFLFGFEMGFFEETWALLKTRLSSELYYTATLQVNLCQERHRADNLLHIKLFRLYKIIMDDNF